MLFHIVTGVQMLHSLFRLNAEILQFLVKREK